MKNDFSANEFVHIDVLEYRLLAKKPNHEMIVPKDSLVLSFMQSVCLNHCMHGHCFQKDNS